MADSRRSDDERRSFEARDPREEERTVFLDQSAQKADAVPPSTSRFENSPPVSIVAYCLASISMTVVNKYVVSGDEWNLHFLYLAIQAVVCIVTIALCKYAGVVKSLAPFEQEKAKKWFPISCLLVGMIYTGNRSLQYLSVPVYTIFKNLTIIAIAYGEVWVFDSKVTPMTLSSFLLMVLSSMIAAWADIKSAMAGDEKSNDLSTLTAGYFWMACNVVCTATYVLGMRKTIHKLQFKDWDTMFYNNLLTIPIVIVMSIITEDWSSSNFARNFPAETRNSIFIGMIYSGAAAIGISFCSAWCIRVTSSTTYSMVGALNKLPIAISGLIFFSAPVTFGSVSAIFLGFVSGLVYAYAKVQQSREAKETLPVAKDDVELADRRTDNPKP
ncbi:GDP-mannose transporter [Sarocladium implicatum]|nr:GDP-mannose transporter [Sarocladium implicatum]